MSKEYQRLRIITVTGCDRDHIEYDNLIALNVCRYMFKIQDLSLEASFRGITTNAVSHLNRESNAGIFEAGKDRNSRNITSSFAPTFGSRVHVGLISPLPTSMPWTLFKDSFFIFFRGLWRTRWPRTAMEAELFPSFSNAFFLSQIYQGRRARLQHFRSLLLTFVFQACCQAIASRGCKGWCFLDYCVMYVCGLQVPHCWLDLTFLNHK